MLSYIKRHLVSHTTYLLQSIGMYTAVIILASLYSCITISNIRPDEIINMLFLFSAFAMLIVSYSYSFSICGIMCNIYLSMGISRRAAFAGTQLYKIISSVVLTALYSLAIFLSCNIFTQPSNDFLRPAVLLAVMIFNIIVFSFGEFIALLTAKIGRIAMIIGMAGFGGIIGGGISLLGYNMSQLDIFNFISYVSDKSIILFAMYFIIVSIVLSVASWLLFFKTTVK